jgi:hypothetical protein
MSDEHDITLTIHSLASSRGDVDAEVFAEKLSVNRHHGLTHPATATSMV